MYNFNKLGSTSSITTAINSKIIKSMPVIKLPKETIKSFNDKISPLFKCMKNNSIEILKLKSVLNNLVNTVIR